MLAAADELGLGDHDLTRAMRCSLDTVHAYRQGRSLLKHGFQLDTADFLCRLATLAKQLVGPDGSPSRWIRQPNASLGAVPLDLLREEWGLGRMVMRLEAEHLPEEEVYGPAAREEKLKAAPGASRGGTSRAKAPLSTPPRPAPPETTGWLPWIAGSAAAGATAAVGVAVWLLRRVR
ncbi:hypothetical protein [Roseomonas sp. BN140053]|uniref:hypothetical protein n=1 Tax=Roseomonas sp. BN140053 TaxID=3391898 RepID=UPI0039E85B77